MPAASVWAIPQPNNEAARPCANRERASTNYINSSTTADSLIEAETQYLGPIPRIIAAHWWRSELAEVAHV